MPIAAFGRFHLPKSLTSSPPLSLKGCYCFNFGICSAPEHFQKRMSQILSRLEGVFCQTDDVLVFSKDQSEHDRRLTAVATSSSRCNTEPREMRIWDIRDDVLGASGQWKWHPCRPGQDIWHPPPMCRNLDDIWGL